MSPTKTTSEDAPMAVSPSSGATSSAQFGAREAEEGARRFFDRAQREMAYAAAEIDYARRQDMRAPYEETVDRDEFRRRYGA